MIKMQRLTHCPFCNDPLDPEDNSDADIYTDKHPWVEERERSQKCRGKVDHTYIQKYYAQDQFITQILIRVGEGEVRYYIEPYMLLNMTRIWSGRNNTREHSVELDKAVKLDFSKGVDGIKEQIKMYLTFS